MKNKTTISIIMALLMVVSTISVVGTVNADDCGYAGTTTIEENLDVVKKIYNGSAWVDEYYAEVGETVNFKIIVTYVPTDTCGFLATNFTVIDNLDPTGGVTYTIDYSSMNYAPIEESVPIQWNLTEDYGVELDSGESFEITFNATIDSGYGSLINTVEVYGWETCCHVNLYGCDTATVIVEGEPCIPGIEVIKKVKNAEGDWVEYVDGLHIGDMVDFKVDIVYTECDISYNLLNGIIRDELPCCLEFSETLSVTTTGEPMDAPTEEVSSDGKTVFWNWTSEEDFELDDGDSITIEFRTEFMQYCEFESDNWVYVQMWGCTPPGQDQIIFEDEDNATVDCRQEDTTFEKTVWNGSAWVKEIYTAEGDTLRFKLELNYYGLDDLNAIKFYDELPCILEYADNLYSNVENIEDYVNVSNDNKEIWWNLTGLTLSDGGSIIIEFDASVTGQTGSDCPLCQCEEDAYNYAEVWGVTGCEEVFFMWDEVLIHSEGNCPPSAPGVTGDITAEVGEEIEIKVKTTDPDGDQVYYLMDWGEVYLGVPWVGPSDSGEEITLTHTYTEAGIYEIYAKAKDINGAESDWSYYPFKVTITEDEIDLSICLPRMSRGMMSATITNNGDDDLAGVCWEITVTGGMMGGVDVSANDTADIDSEDHADVDTGAGSIGFGFGKVTGTVNVAFGDYEKSVDFSGFLVGKTLFAIKTVE